jgi:hypothetical protein
VARRKKSQPVAAPPAPKTVKTVSAYAPGEGLVEEEVIEEEEYEFTPLKAHHGDEHDLEELEEETLQQQIRSGALGRCCRRRISITASSLSRWMKRNPIQMRRTQSELQRLLDGQRDKALRAAIEVVIEAPAADVADAMAVAVAPKTAGADQVASRGVRRRLPICRSSAIC